MASKQKPIVQLISTSRCKLQPDDLRFEPPARSKAWKLLLLVILVGVLTVGELLGFGSSFPTLVDFLNGSGNQ